MPRKQFSKQLSIWREYKSYPIAFVHNTRKKPGGRLLNLGLKEHSLRLCKGKEQPSGELMEKWVKDLSLFSISIIFWSLSFIIVFLIRSHRKKFL